MEEKAANILVVDDEIGMREGCRRALTSQGFRVSTAEHGAEALRKLREDDYDLVLLDAMMPGMSGLEILERIHEHDADIISVMITGYATVDLAAQAMKQGAHDFLPKPFTSDELLTVVLRGMEERQRRLDVRRHRAEEEESHQLERTRQERAKLEAIASRFMLVVVHELRNPAGVIKNYLQLMRAGYVDVEEYDEYVEKLDLRAGQLLSMLDDLLELANLKGRHGLEKPKPVPLARVLEKVIQRLQTQAEGKNLALDVDIRAEPALLGQEAHFESLWMNLIENAIHYTPQGQVSVSLFEEGDKVVTTVVDSGLGISTEELARIFQEFYRSEQAKEQVNVGTGLGLPIVNQIVEIYQGTIDVDSAPGKGSTFTVTLPRAGV
jgi:two-component system, sensor histidine kinase and response regulator